MKWKKITNMYKLSTAFPGTSETITVKRLAGFRKLVSESNSIAEAMAQIAGKLRHIPATGGAPPVFTTLEDNRVFLETATHNSADISYQDFVSFSGVKALMVYIEGMVNKDHLNRDVIQPFTANFEKLATASTLNRNEARKLFAVSSLTDTQKLSEVLDAIIDGNTVVFIERLDTAFIIDARSLDKRAVAEPDTEAVTRGPREGFIESVRTNLTLLRRKVKNSNLVFEEFSLGKQTNTLVYIAYIDGIVNHNVLQEVRTRLRKIDIDSVLDTGYIEQFIEESWGSPLATVGNTQKPDVVAGKLLEGRVAIFCDGTPHVLTIPNLFTEAIQSPEDYYMRPLMASMLRFFRILAVFVGILGPGLYVALQTFHQEMIPTILLLRMAGSMEGVPFPAAVEAFIMVFFFELLREAGTRLPRPIGSAISIVGALIIGEGAVNAGLVSAPVVIVIALTAVASFIVPALTEVMTIYRFFFLLLGGTMGLYGITCGMFLVLTHAVSLRSFGIPYTSSIAPMNRSGLKDFVPRFPLWMMKLRPPFMVKQNAKRRNNGGS
jgi:spore germination protein KA